MPDVRNVAILLFDDVEVLDFAGPFEMFAVTGPSDSQRPFNVYTVAEKPGPITARNGLSINPSYTISNCPTPDILIVPGGRGTRREMHNPVLLDWIKAHAARAELTLSVCTGALLLAKSGLLNGLAATTHRSAFGLLREVAPNTTVYEDRRIVDNGQIVLSAGVSAGIDLALHVIARLLGEDVARATAYHTEYDYWQPIKD
jgi:transcriptional regulator GlxA family with amidase domain